MFRVSSLKHGKLGGAHVCAAGWNALIRTTALTYT